MFEIIKRLLGLRRTDDAPSTQEPPPRARGDAGEEVPGKSAFGSSLELRDGLDVSEPERTEPMPLDDKR